MRKCSLNLGIRESRQKYASMAFTILPRNLRTRLPGSGQTYTDECPGRYAHVSRKAEAVL